MAKGTTTVVMPDRRAADKQQTKQQQKQQAKATTATLTDEQKKQLSKQRRDAKKQAYPTTILTLKLHKGAQHRDVIDAMLAAQKVWAQEHSYVLSVTEPTQKKSGSTAMEVTIDTPESFADRVKTGTRGEATQAREISKAITTALRSEQVKAKAIELGTSPKDLVLTALSSQFGIKLEVS